jgi:hypothetical protein
VFLFFNYLLLRNRRHSKNGIITTLAKTDILRITFRPRYKENKTLGTRSSTSTIRCFKNQNIKRSFYFVYKNLIFFILAFIKLGLIISTLFLGHVTTLVLLGIV